MTSLLSFFDENNKLEAGVDEVARGTLFGPVFAASVILDKNKPIHAWLNDSKKVSRKKRAVVRQWIEENAISWAVSFVDNSVIDKINIRNSSMLAMEMSLQNLSVIPDFILIDGNYFPGTASFGKWKNYVTDYKQNHDLTVLDISFKTIVTGDSIFASIAAASILAKEHHDDYIKDLVKKNPLLDTCYDLGNNMGYGTPKHISGLKNHGKTVFHRETFLGKILKKKWSILDSIGI